MREAALGVPEERRQLKEEEEIVEEIVEVVVDVVLDSGESGGELPSGSSRLGMVT